MLADPLFFSQPSIPFDFFSSSSISSPPSFLCSILNQPVAACQLGHAGAADRVGGPLREALERRIEARRASAEGTILVCNFSNSLRSLKYTTYLVTY